MHLKSIILGHIRPPSHHCHAILSHKGAMALILPLLEENHLGQSDQRYVLLKFWAWMETLQEPHLPIPMASLAWKPGKIPSLLPEVLTQDTVNSLHRWIFNEPQLQPFCILVSGHKNHVNFLSSSGKLMSMALVCPPGRLWSVVHSQNNRAQQDIMFQTSSYQVFRNLSRSAGLYRFVYTCLYIIYLKAWNSSWELQTCQAVQMPCTHLARTLSQATKSMHK